MHEGQAVKLKGRYKFELIRDGKVIDEWSEDNIVVNQGLDHILGVEFAQVAQVQTWYISLFKNNYVPVATDTANSIGANAGECTTFGQTRQPFTVVEAAQQATNSASPASFTFTGPDNVTGAFLVSAQAVGSQQGVLFSAIGFQAARAVLANDQLAISYTVGAASA